MIWLAAVTMLTFVACSSDEIESKPEDPSESINEKPTGNMTPREWRVKSHSAGLLLPVPSVISLCCHTFFIKNYYL